VCSIIMLSHPVLPVLRTTCHRTLIRPRPLVQGRGHSHTGRCGGGLILLCMLCGWLLLSVLLHWWQVTQDDWHYGRPRTYQTDARVGHNDSATPSHFTVWNLHGQIVVIEFPGGDARNAVSYLGPALPGTDQDLTPATVEFRDVNGDGKPDMVLLVQGTPFVFLNDGSRFHAPSAPS